MLGSQLSDNCFGLLMFLIDVLKEVPAREQSFQREDNSEDLER